MGGLVLARWWWEGETGWDRAFCVLVGEWAWAWLLFAASFFRTFLSSLWMGGWDFTALLSSSALVALCLPTQSLCILQ